MKRIIVLLIALMPLLVVAQSAMDEIFEKYSGKDGFTTVNIGPDMFKLLANANVQINGTDDADLKEAQDAMKNLQSLRILTCESADKDLCMRFRKEVFRSVPDDYLEMMTVKDDQSDVKFLARQDKDGTITELLMVVIDSEDVVLMSFTGKIDMQTISKIGSTMQIDGMDNLYDYHENEEEEE